MDPSLPSEEPPSAPMHDPSNNNHNVSQATISLARAFAEHPNPEYGLRRLEGMVEGGDYYKASGEGGKNIWSFICVCYARALYQMGRADESVVWTAKAKVGLGAGRSEWKDYVRAEAEKVEKCGVEAMEAQEKEKREER